MLYGLGLNAFRACAIDKIDIDIAVRIISVNIGPDSDDFTVRYETLSGAREEISVSSIYRECWSIISSGQVGQLEGTLYDNTVFYGQLTEKYRSWNIERFSSGSVKPLKLD